jgi:5S rRNA maturation endonuclease (ribonuclease M5)
VTVASPSVSREQRHRRGNPCPICEGKDSDPRGKGARCNGFTSNDQKWVHCSRREHAGGIAANDAGLFAHRMHGLCNCGMQHGPDIVRAPTFTAEYPYHDENGALLFQVLRKPDKSFLQRRPDGANGWIWRLEDTRRVPYGLRKLIDADPAAPVFVCEGEKDVETAWSLGMVATCNPGGAGKWSAVQDTASTVLKGRDVVVIADADEPGRKHAKDVEASLRGHAKSVRIIEMPDGHKDLTDAVRAGVTLPQILARATGPVSNVAPSQPIVWADELAKPLPPVEWICKHLRIARGGRPSVIAGENGGFKSLLAMDLLVCGAADVPLFDQWPLAKGLRVLDLDYEQGRTLTARRYQRIARAKGFELGTLGRRLGYRFRPFYWNAAGARDQLRRLVDGFDLVKVDPFAACTEGIDENSSAVRAALDLAISVSEETGTTFLFVDHAGKPPTDGSKRSRKHTQRGHSSKTDANQTLIVLSREKGEPALVTCERDQVSGVFFPDFRFDVEDVPSEDGTEPHWGIRLVMRELPRSADRSPEAAHVAAIEKIRNYLRLHHDGVAGISALASRVALRASDVRNAWKEMVASGEGENTGTDKRPNLRLTATGFAASAPTTITTLRTRSGEAAE